MSKKVEVSELRRSRGHGKRVQKFFYKPSRTKQSFKDECDINQIMKRFSKVQQQDYLEKMNGYAGGQFGDFSTVTNYQDAIEQVRSAQSIFERIPAKVRAEFNYDPAYFLDFCQNPANKDALIKMGLAKPAQAPSNEQKETSVP